MLSAIQRLTVLVDSPVKRAMSCARKNSGAPVIAVHPAGVAFGCQSPYLVQQSRGQPAAPTSEQAQSARSVPPLAALSRYRIALTHSPYVAGRRKDFEMAKSFSVFL
jgi:hypothetical protein